MTTSIEIDGWVYAEEKTAWKPNEATGGHERTHVGWNVTVLPRQSAAVDVWGVCVGKLKMTYDIPADFDIAAETVRQKVAALEKEKAEAMREYQAKVAQINEQLSKLQAITIEG
jgi:hypothetical protein